MPLNIYKLYLIGWKSYRDKLKSCSTFKNMSLFKNNESIVVIIIFAIVNMVLTGIHDFPHPPLHFTFAFSESFGWSWLLA